MLELQHMVLQEGKHDVVIIILLELYYYVSHLLL